MSGQKNSTVAELSKFNMKAANEHYKVEKEDSLEAILLALHVPGEKEKLDLSPRVTGCHPSFIFRYVLTLRVNIASQHVAKRIDLYLRVDIAS